MAEEVKLNHFETQIKNLIICWRDIADIHFFEIKDVLEYFNEFSFYAERELPIDKIQQTLNLLGGTLIKRSIKKGGLVYEILD